MPEDHTRQIEVAAGVARHLDGNWKHDTRGEDPKKWVWAWESIVFNVDNPRMRFAITNGGAYADRHKLQASGDWHVFKHRTSYWPDRHSIMFSPGRNIPAIAADINRRFLPKFIEQWHRADKQERETITNQETIKNKLDMLRKVLPGMHSLHGRRDHNFYTDLQGLQFGVHGDTIEISRLDLSFEQFIQLVYKLKEQ